MITTSYNLSKSIFPTNGVPKMRRWKDKQCRPSMEQSDLGRSGLCPTIKSDQSKFAIKKTKLLSQVVKKYFW